MLAFIIIRSPWAKRQTYIIIIDILLNGQTVEREVRIPTLLEKDSIQLKTVIKEQITYHGVKNIVINLKPFRLITKIENNNILYYHHP